MGSARAYLPLFTLILLSFLAATALQLTESTWSWMPFMHHFMGLFLLIFSLLKLFNLPSFAEAFRKYDLLAKHTRFYAILYPFLELALALAYLSQISLSPTYLATIILMGFGALGILHALRQKRALTCACMGSSLKVPLSHVALIENLSMTTMALVMWLL